MNARRANPTEDKVRDLQRALYRATKAKYGSADSGAMNDLGEPGAGESHARFDEGGLETGPVLVSWRLSALCGWCPTYRLPRQPSTLRSRPVSSRRLAGVSPAKGGAKTPL